MTDIVERLRKGEPCTSALVDLAIVEIERLRERISELYRAEKSRVLSAKSIGHDIGALQAEVERLRAEVDEYQRIRDLAVKALMLATGRSKAEIEAMPYTCASRHRKEVERLRANNRAAGDIAPGKRMATPRQSPAPEAPSPSSQSTPKS